MKNKIKYLKVRNWMMNLRRDLLRIDNVGIYYSYSCMLLYGLEWGMYHTRAISMEIHSTYYRPGIWYSIV